MCAKAFSLTHQQDSQPEQPPRWQHLLSMLSPPFAL